MSATVEHLSAAGHEWYLANARYLEEELARLRLLIQLRVLWLRHLWQRDLAPESQNFNGMIVTDAEADHLLWPGSAEAEAGFYAQNESAQQVLRLLAGQRARIAQAAQEAQACGAPPALEILGRLFHLEEFELNVLLLCLAPAIDPSFERLYGYVQDDATQKYPTVGMAMRIFGRESGTRGEAEHARDWRHFAPTAPLQRFRLLYSEQMPGVSRAASEPLRLHRRIADYLLGINQMDEQVAAVARLVIERGVLGPDQEEVAGLLERRLRAWNDREQMPVIQLTGPATAGHQAIAGGLCSRCGVALYAVDPAAFPAAAGDRQAFYRILEREAILSSCAYYIDCSGFDRSNRAEASQLLAFLDQVQTFIVIACREPIRTERRMITFRLVKSEAAAQLAVWKTDLTGQLPEQARQNLNGLVDGLLARLIQQFHLSPQQIHRVVEEACETASLRNPERPVLESRDLWQTARMQAARSMDGLAERIEARRSFDELVLPFEQLQQILEIASQVEQRSRVYEQWGFGARLNRGRGIAALFAGPSGTGKTMAAEVLAHHLDLDLYRIDLASVISKYIGETEKNLRRVFDAAEESGAILFFDEADALFGKRSEVRDSHDRYANIEINYLLQRMEDYRGLAILATNRKSLLDQAFLRRLRFLVDFPFPSAPDRARIWRLAFPPQAEKEALDYESLGRLEITGGNISNIALNAAFLAAGEGTSIQMRHVMTAARREYAKIDKLMVEGEFGRYSSPGVK